MNEATLPRPATEECQEPPPDPPRVPRLSTEQANGHAFGGLALRQLDEGPASLISPEDVRGDMDGRLGPVHEIDDAPIGLFAG